MKLIIYCEAFSENESDDGELSCSNLDSEEDIRLSESDCEESEESADIIDNIPVNPDIYRNEVTSTTDQYYKRTETSSRIQNSTEGETRGGLEAQDSTTPAYLSQSRYLWSLRDKMAMRKMGSEFRWVSGWLLVHEQHSDTTRGRRGGERKEKSRCRLKKFSVNSRLLVLTGSNLCSIQTIFHNGRHLGEEIAHYEDI
ncbi:hypothetical protein TNCV_2979971 [Trichonephila clavipes]|nr:hypothetical protein TNCV_2979971 [Trichonephila clavipes]